MENLTAWSLASATADQREVAAEKIVDHVWEALRPPLIALVVTFLGQPLSPQNFARFELAVFGLIRELGRLLLQGTVNALEPESPLQLPSDLWYQASGYRRRNEKTRNRNVATLCGTITLWRRGYRSWDATDGSIFPLELLLGLTHGVTPGLADWLGRKMAEAGASQQRVLQWLRDEHSVSMGVKRLRMVIDAASQGMAEFRQENQVETLLKALKTAQDGTGPRKPVLAVGRDGITLREYRHRFFEVATAATVSVYDRWGKRLMTVYLAWPPELGQATMDRMLTDLLQEVFVRWDGRLPRLAYVSDCGGNESSYYQKTLRRMRHPLTGRRLPWQRVVDYYHVAERVWTMAAKLFGAETKQSAAWAHRMLKALKKPSGASRVLHSAASHYHRRDLKPAAAKKFWTAYRYIQSRTRFLRYHEYAALHIPLGSGVTEAACKTIFTQRMKLSGMRWSQDGARTILGLRVILLSGTWNRTFSSYLDAMNQPTLPPYAPRSQIELELAA